MTETDMPSRRALLDRPFAAPLVNVWRGLTRPPMPPSRVARAIRDAEAVSEILVAWVQLAGAVVMVREAAGSIVDGVAEAVDLVIVA